MRVHGNNLPGQDTSAYDADALVFEEESVVVGSSRQGVERVRPRPTGTRIMRQRPLFRHGHRYARIAQRCTMFEAIITAKLSARARTTRHCCVHRSARETYSRPASRSCAYSEPISLAHSAPTVD